VSDDAELLERWNAGDGSAGEALFEKHFDALYRFFRNKVNEDCGELVQRTLMACLEKRDKVRNAESLRAFVFGCARFELLRYFRRRSKREREVDFADASVHDLDPSPSRIVAKQREQRVLLEALRRIPLELQIVVELHYWESMTTAEIAEVIEVPVGTVKSRLRRARERLEAELATIAKEPALLESTVAGLEGWVAGIKDLLGDG
jgi:RNA polymerase sigma factor (sigma-70 family)